MSTVVVLGANGMLGSSVARKLSNVGHDVFATVRSSEAGEAQVGFDVLEDSLEKLGSLLPPSAAYVVNCIGVIKPRINESIRTSVEQAIRINATFPHELAALAEVAGLKVIQIATDCVYSGVVGQYDEHSVHDPSDIYGKTKSLGEVKSENVMHLRCSIVGPEIGRSTSLWEWAGRQPRSAEVLGYVNHRWNGITTDAFGEICHSIINNDLFIDGVTHVVPNGVVTKEQLVKMILSKLGRTDVVVQPMDAPTVIDRTLSTLNQKQNSAIWSGTSFNNPPTIEQMIEAVELLAT